MTKLNTILLVSTLFLAVCFGYEKDGEVLVLTDSDLADAINEHQFLLVEFYAPWCGHCKKLEPEYLKAASQLASQGVHAVLAKVDATENPTGAQEHGVRGYPTLKWFVNGKASDYGGGRTASEIVSWISKKTGPAFKTLSTKEEVEAFKASHEVAVVAFFGTESAHFKTFESVAQGVDEVAFAIISVPSVAAELESEGSIVLFKKFDEGRVAYSGEVNQADLEQFVQTNSIPLVPVFSQETAPKIFGSGVESHFLYFNDAKADSHSHILEQVREVANEFRGKTLFVFVPSSEERVMSFFDFKKDNLPQGILVALGEGDMKKFGFNEELTAANIRSHVAAFHSGSLKPTLKSEEVPEDNSGPVRVLVGTTFNEIVLDETKDVLVEFYAPWCGHCKSLTPIYEQLGESFASNQNIIIAKIDATANDVDHPAVHVQGFPTIIFFPANGKDTPTVYDGERDLESLKAFVQENAKAQPSATTGKEDL
jgi:protein disulfide-isomerase A1